eukprot:CAMPEP_0184647088 /NCGR_PEP_ID=MMETSP0308-20130426/3985_1 /TAXON_ID=38269 /ORGANISM="Gloeochaete witrockiana, Strain SAG 46.84" /LENGTH=67 /DNA_ID=CAMNT_0027077799 /DNA_START=270 /DNA_END=473 /DNA_ORIENTATION=+
MVAPMSGTKEPKTTCPDLFDEDEALSTEKSSSSFLSAEAMDLFANFLKTVLKDGFFFVQTDTNAATA